MMGKKFVLPFPEHQCKYNTLKTESGETAVACNEWDFERNCDKCGWNPQVAELRLLRKYPLKEVKKALEVSYQNSITNPNYKMPKYEDLK